MYNGWPNYETWLTYIWLSNDSLVDQTCALLAQRASTITDVADALEEFVEEHLTPLEEPGLASDLLRAALRHIDWRRLAQRYAQP